MTSANSLSFVCMWNKRSIIAFLVIINAGMFVSGCGKNKEDHKIGNAIGFDLRECVCCGGLFVEYHSDTLLFPEIPDEIITWAENYGFPLRIACNFKKLDESCGFDWYEMTYVELLEHP